MSRKRRALVLVPGVIVVVLVLSMGLFAASLVESPGSYHQVKTDTLSSQTVTQSITTQQWMTTMFTTDQTSSPASNSTTTTNSSVTIDLNVENGSTVCPSDLGGDGKASWNPEADTCTLSSAGPYSPTLCVGTASSLCVSDRTTDLVIGPGVAFVLNSTSLAIYTTLDNYGSINATAGYLVNYGVVDNHGNIDAFDLDNLPFAGHGVINNFANSTITTTWSFNNIGLTVNNGTLNDYRMVSECTQTNLALYCGTIQNFGTMNCLDSCTIQTTTTESQPTDNATDASSGPDSG